MSDFPHLAAAIQARARELGYDQERFIAAVHVSRSTVQRLWTGSATYRPSAKTIAEFERVLEWEPGSIDAVLEGAEPTPRREILNELQTSAAEATADAYASASTDLPLDVQLSLGEGRTIGTDTIEWPVPGTTFSVIVVVKSGIYDTDEKLAALRDQRITWAKMKKGIREAVERAIEEAEPAEDE